MRRWLAPALVGLGIAGYVSAEGRNGEPEPARFWSATPPWVPDRNVGIDLDGTTLRLEPNAGQCELMTLTVVPLRDEWSCEVTLISAAGDQWTAVFRAEPDGGEVRLGRGGAEPRSAAQASQHDFGSGVTKLSLRTEASRLEAAVDGTALVSLEDENFQPVKLGSRIRGSGVRLFEMRQRGRAGTQRVDRRERFELHGGPASDHGWAARSMHATIALLLLAAFLHAQCGAATPIGRTLGATLAAAAAPALPWAADLAATVPHREVASATLLFPGVLLGGYRLRDRLAPDRARPNRASPWIALIVTGSAAAFIGRERMADDRETVEAAVREAGRLSVAPSSRSARFPLHAGNNYWIPGRARNVELAADVDLAPDSVLEVRLRSHPTRPEGVALLLSADPHVRSGFYRQSAVEHRFLGTGRAEPIAPGRRELLIEARGPWFEARLDGEPIASARYAGSPAGTVGFLAVRGRAAVSRVNLRPSDEPERGYADAWRLLAPAILPGGVAMAALALLSAWWLGAPFAWAAGAQSFSWIPVALLHAGDEEPTKRAIALAALAGALAAILSLCLKGRATTGPRAVLLTLASAAAAAVTTVAAAPPLPASGGQIADVAAVGSIPLFDDRLYHTHPNARGLNGYLTRHEFRGRRYRVPKPPGAVRVICLGASSTYGFRLRAEDSYPAALQRMLDEEGRVENVEVINAAWGGTNTAFLYRFLRDGLLEFEPDVVTLSLYYNDSFSLTQWDLERHLRAIDGLPVWRRMVENVRASVELMRGRTTLAETLRRFEVEGMGSMEAYLASRTVALAPPPVRYESQLRRFCELARERGFTMVFMLEPVADDRRRLWKEEFHQVMRAVAEEYGFPVVDPTPALLDAGGAELYLEGDEIHPRPEGNLVIASVLLPAVRDVLLERRRRAGR